MSALRIISYGGGVQSTALVVLGATGQEIGHVDAAVFANVGDDSEHPATTRYVRDVAIPWAAERGFEVVETERRDRRGNPVTLLGRLEKDSRTIDIPVRMANGAPGRRKCTVDFKIDVVARWLKKHGASPAEPATVLIGFSTDEIERVGRRRNVPAEVHEYPLLDLGLSRQDCANIIRRAGLPVPHKSACWWCPFHRPDTWAEMRRDEPELFWQSVELERLLNRRRDELGKDHVYLTRFGRPLDEAIHEAQPTLSAVDEHGETCDEGYCWT